MLYDAYEMQRSMLASASAMANFGAGLLQNPANPFAYLGGGYLQDATNYRYSFFVQDAWSVGRRLTINPGQLAAVALLAWRQMRSPASQGIHRARKLLGI